MSYEEGLDIYCFPLTKSEVYSFGVICLYVIPSSVTISQYLLVRFDAFLVYIISTMYSQYRINFAKFDSLILQLLPLM